MALLAKQAWRIMSDPDSISANVLKAKYFESADFKSATITGHPSTIWRSIMIGKELLFKGLRWRVGTGENIDIINDPWIPALIDFRTHPRMDTLPDRKVSYFINPSTRLWRKDIICDIFNPYEAEKILSIPLSPGPREDKLIWHFTTNGIYSVRSGYHLAYEQKYNLTTNMASSSSSTGSNIWRTLWKLKIKPRISHFLWKIIHNALPTGLALQTRGIGDGFCHICQLHKETTWHCIFECDIPKAVWKNYHLGGFLQKLQLHSFSEFFNAIFQLESEEELVQIIHIMWHIWKARNEFLFEGRPARTNSILASAKAEADEFLSCMLSKVITVPRAPMEVKWTPPNHGMLKFNIDAAFGDKITAVGGILRNADGTIIRSFSRKLEGSFEVLIGEALAMYHAMVFALTWWFFRVIFEGDSQLIHYRLNNPSEDLSPVGSIIEDCRMLLPAFVSSSFSFVKRQGNVAAHLLAREGLHLVGCVEWGSSPPSHVIRTCIADSD